MRLSLKKVAGTLFCIKNVKLRDTVRFVIGDPVINKLQIKAREG